MAWSSKEKDISTTLTSGHELARPGVVGRPPRAGTIQFTPMDFFGAAARCSHLNTSSPLGVIAESDMIAKLVEQHVDDTSRDFFVLKSADRFKDYVKSYFAGTVAAGLSYLQMIGEGYIWCDHFEELGGGVAGVAKKPDFVFARRNASDVALVESKGTRSARPRAFDRTVEEGYVGQVEPHLGQIVGASTASHGFCIGGWLTSSSKAELYVHYTATPVGGAGGGSDGPGGASPAGGPGDIAPVQRGNYATVFRIVHSEVLAQQVRLGQLQRDQQLRFLEVEWLGERFLTTPFEFRLSRFIRPPRDHGFALLRAVAVQVLAGVSGDAPAGPLDLPEISQELMAAAHADGGALFPDGFAVFSRASAVESQMPVDWNHDKREFEHPEELAGHYASLVSKSEVRYPEVEFGIRGRVTESEARPFQQPQKAFKTFESES